jgi:hypothetical protein
LSGIAGSGKAGDGIEHLRITVKDLVPFLYNFRMPDKLAGVFPLKPDRLPEQFLPD